MGSSTPQFSANHIVNPETGFLENPAYPSDFDSERKLQFLKAYKENHLGFYKTCRQLGLSHSTVNRHYHVDPVFKREFDHAQQIYTDDLEVVSRENAMNPKSVIERIFQLKSLKPEKYADQRREMPLTISINVDSALLSKVVERSKVLDAEEIRELGGEAEVKRFNLPQEEVSRVENKP